jgi:hypothetical protein
LAGHGDHAIHQVGFDNLLSDFSFAGLVTGMLPLAKTKPAIPVGAK